MKLVLRDDPDLDEKHKVNSLWNALCLNEFDQKAIKVHFPLKKKYETGDYQKLLKAVKDCLYTSMHVD